MQRVCRRRRSQRGGGSQAGTPGGERNETGRSSFRVTWRRYDDETRAGWERCAMGEICSFYTLLGRTQRRIWDPLAESLVLSHGCLALPIPTQIPPSFEKTTARGGGAILSVRGDACDSAWPPCECCVFQRPEVCPPSYLRMLRSGTRRLGCAVGGDRGSPRYGGGTARASVGGPPPRTAGSAPYVASHD